MQLLHVYVAVHASNTGSACVTKRSGNSAQVCGHAKAELDDGRACEKLLQKLLDFLCTVMLAAELEHVLQASRSAFYSAACTACTGDQRANDKAKQIDWRL